MTINPKIYDTLDELGVPAHVLGYDYLAAGVQYILDHKDEHPAMTKELYPKVAESFGTTATRYERAVRHAIDLTFDYTRNMSVIIKYFGNSINPEKGKAPNSQFLYTIANHISRAAKE